MDKKPDNKVVVDNLPPEVEEVSSLFRTTYTDLNEFLSRCRKNEQVRKCIWAGQSDSQRKEGVDAFPFEGASDMKVPLAEVYVMYVVSAVSEAIKRMRPDAVPASSEFNDIRRARVVSEFVRWMFYLIPDGETQVARFISDLCTYNIGVTTQYWMREKVRTIKKLTVEDMPEELLGMIMDPMAEDTLVAAMLEFGKVAGFELEDEEHAREVIVNLREEGEAEVYRVSLKVDRGALYTLSPVEDVFFPVSTGTDAQRAPYYFHLMYYPVKDLKAKVASEKWNKAWVDFAKGNLVGQDCAGVFSGSTNFSSGSIQNIDKLKDTVQVIHLFQKKADKRGVIGVYETIFSPGNPNGFAKRSLSEYEHGQYPIEVTKLDVSSPRLYEGKAPVEMFEGLQNNYKLEVDMNNDRNQLATCPPILRMISRDTQAARFKPRAEIPIRRVGEYSFLSPPPFNPGSVETKREISRMANMIVGRAGEDITPAEAQVRLQYILSRVSSHLSRALNQLFKLSKQYSTSEVWFKVLGTQDSLSYKKSEDDDFSFRVILDSVSMDWEQLQGQAKMMIEAMKIDPVKVGAGAVATEIINMINPNMGDRVVQGGNDAREKSVQEEVAAIAAVSSGVPADISEDDMKNQIKAQVFMQWLQSEAGQTALQSPVIGPAVQHRAKQWEQAAVQMQNASVGRFGNQPSGVQV